MQRGSPRIGGWTTAQKCQDPVAVASCVVAGASDQQLTLVTVAVTFLYVPALAVATIVGPLSALNTPELRAFAIDRTDPESALVE